MLQLDAVQTVAFGGVTVFAGYALCRMIPLLRRYNLPEPVVGGMLVALLAWAAHGQETVLFTLDTTLKEPLMIAFFTTLGINASVRVLRASGGQVLVFLLLAAGFAVVQNLVGISVAGVFGQHPMFGVLAGSATMAGGPATGMAFAPLFEQAGLRGAETLAITAAMAGIICGGVVGGPVITLLMRRFHIHGQAAGTGSAEDAESAVHVRYPSEGAREFDALKSLIVLLVVMWLGSWVSQGFAHLGLTLPAYIGAMLVGAMVRNVDDYTGLLRLSVPTTELIGNVCLALFLAIALMDLRLWELAGMGGPLLVTLLVQVIIVAMFVVPIYWLMGRDYDAAVMGGGFVGFMLGTSANAMAVMRRLVQRYGPAPRAFLVVPLVGAFFIDFINALIITGFLNVWPY